MATSVEVVYLTIIDIKHPAKLANFSDPPMVPIFMCLVEQTMADESTGFSFR